MTRFLRFDIGGATALLWTFIFISPHLNIDALTQVDAMKIFAVTFGSITLSIPLGNFIHQFADTVFNPFARRRLLFWPRAVIEYINRELGTAPAFYDRAFQVVLVFSKAHNRKLKKTRSLSSAPIPRTASEQEVEFKVEILREEIANRYSYYYARIENGGLSPILGGVFAWLVFELLRETRYVTEYPAFSLWWILCAAIFGAVPVLWRIPQLFRELDDLEVALVMLQRDSWPTPTSTV